MEKPIMDELPLSKRKQAGNRVMSCDEFKAYVGSEHDLTVLCEDWLNENRMPFIRIPDAVYKAVFGNSGMQPWVKRLISSFIKGLPDFIILKPQDSYNMALCIELKTKTGKMSQGQKNFARLVNVVIVRSYDDFKKQVNDFYVN